MARQAEELGYQSVWLAEVAGPEASALAAAIASATETMAMGIAVLPAATRTPALVAMIATTVSQLLEGRELAVGIGSSSQLIAERWHGRTFDPPLARVREAVLATRAVLEGERAFGGETVSFDGFRLPSPPAGPVRLYVGALGPKMLQLAGAVADGVCLNLMPPESVARQRDELQRGSDESGRALPDHFKLMARLHVLVTDDLAAGRDIMRTAFGPYFAQPVYNRFLAWNGLEREAAQILDCFQRGDRAGVAAALTDDVVDAVALVGNAASVRKRLEQYDQAGIDIAALNVFAPNVEAVSRALEALRP